MAMEAPVIPKPAYIILHRLTGESRPDVALSLALKDLARFRLEAARSKIAIFEQKYAMSFEVFEKEWKVGKIPEAYSYPVEKDYWEWEAATTDVTALDELAQLRAASHSRTRASTHTTSAGRRRGKGGSAE